MTILEILDQDQAKIWLAEVERVNDDTRKLLDQTGVTLQEVKDDADGAIIDDLYHWGTKMCDAATEIFKATSTIAEGVKKFLEGINETIDKGKDIIKDAIKKIVGLGQ